MDVDIDFGGLRDQVVGGLRNILGGVQGTITYGGDQGAAVDIGFGERRVMSVMSLVIVGLVGIVLGAVLFGRKGG